MNKIAFNTKTNKYDCVINGKSFSSGNQGYIEYKHKLITGVKKPFGEIIGTSVAAAENAPMTVDMKFEINTRFSFVEKVVKMVASGVQASAVITGEGGLGKSFTVLKTLRMLGMKSVNDLPVGAEVNRKDVYVQIKGFSTAKGLYRSLYENNGSCILFDDCDSILGNPVAINILKGALDSYDERIISWNAETKGDDDLPRSFVFTGKIIFISNMAQSKIDQAIRSRSMLIDLTMTASQKIDRMAHLVEADDFMEDYTISVKRDALSFIRKMQDTASEISLRTLIAVAKIRATNDDWEDLAEYVICR